MKKIINVLLISMMAVVIMGLIPWQHAQAEGNEVVNEVINIVENSESSEKTVDDSSTVEASGGESAIANTGKKDANDSVAYKNITLKKIWDDENNKYRLRPESLEGWIKYKVTSETGSGQDTVEETITSSDWTKDNNIWTSAFEVPDNAEIVDWGDSPAPDAYASTKGKSEDDANTFEITSSIKTFTFTLEKKTTVRDANGERFQFFVKTSGFEIPGVGYPSPKNDNTWYDSYLKNGWGVLYLEKDEKIVVNDVPYGASFNIREVGYNYFGYGYTHRWKLQEPQSGAVTDDTDVVFLNEPESEGYIAFRKNTDVPTNEKFKFRAKFWQVLDDGSISYPDVNFLLKDLSRIDVTPKSDGYYEFELGTSETLLVNAPYLCYYEFEEILDGEWTPLRGAWSAKSAVVSGQMRSQVSTMEAIFGPGFSRQQIPYEDPYIYNRKNPDLTFSKTVNGNTADKSRTYNITAKVSRQISYGDGSDPEMDGNEWLSGGMDIRLTDRVASILGKEPDEVQGQEHIWWDVTSLFKEYIEEHNIQPDEWGYYSFDIENGAVLDNQPAMLSLYFDVQTENGEIVDIGGIYLGVGRSVTEYRDLSEFGGSDNGDGSYTFKLKHGDSVEISNFDMSYYADDGGYIYPWQYEIVEDDYSSEGYTTTVDGNEGRSVSGTIDNGNNKSHSFVNSKEDSDDEDTGRITVKKTSDKDEASAGDEITYTITVKNEGNGSAGNLKITDSLSEGLEYVSSEPEGENTGQDTIWIIESLAANTAETFTLKARVTSGASGSVTNSVKVDNPDDDSSSTTTAEVTIKKEEEPDTPETTTPETTPDKDDDSGSTSEKTPQNGDDSGSTSEKTPQNGDDSGSTSKETPHENTGTPESGVSKPATGDAYNLAVWLSISTISLFMLFVIYRRQTGKRH